MHMPFGKDQYYYGYYIVNYYTKEGLGLGYVGFYSNKKGQRTVCDQHLRHQRLI